MSRNSIGQFIAALRKSNGMTQQEVADRLNVSNKAVSRWERDECAPDISLIPSLAEMFGVTCDELLKGERILDAPLPAEKKEPKVQKQIKSLINRTLSGFKTLIYVSLAVSVVSLICMFGISYGFYRPNIGFAVMLLLEVGALFLGILAVSRARAVKADNELFEEAEDSLIAKFDRTLGSFSFNAFFAVLSVVLLSLPLIFNTEYYNIDIGVNDRVVITLKSYLTTFFGGIALILAMVFLKGRKPYIERFTGGFKNPAAQKIRILNIVQLGLMVFSIIITVTMPYSVVVFKEENIWESLIGGIVRLACLAAMIIFFVLYLRKNKDFRESLILTGIRNICLFPAEIIFSYAIGLWGYAHNEGDGYKWEVIWSPDKLWYAGIYVMLIFVIFSVIGLFIKRRGKQ